MTAEDFNNYVATAKRLEADLKDALYNCNGVYFAKSDGTAREFLTTIGEAAEKISKDVQAALRGY